MQLVKLYIEQYKNLNQLDIDFSDNENVSVIIGNNGSGKSNIVEAISGIFGGLYLQDPHKIFRNANKPKGTQSPFDYKIEYTIGTKNIKAEYANATGFSFKVDDTDMIPSDFFKRSEELLPSQVIANYSGEEGRLFDIFYWPFYSSFTAEFLSIGKLPSITQKLFFVNKYYWDLALLTMLYRQELNNRQGQVNKELDSFLKDVLNIQTVDNIHFSFNPVKYKKYPQTETIQLVTKLNPQKKKSNSLTLAELTDILDNNTDKYFFNLLTTAYMPAKEKILPEIRIDFNGTIDSTCFSEGEKKLILLQFILEILADDESLILLDEPDSHIHISRKELIKDLIDKYSKRKNVLTTHSPMLIKQFGSKNILPVVKNNNVVSINKNTTTISTLIEQLTDGRMSYDQQLLLMNTDKNILLVEGKYDTYYLKKALDILNVKLNNKYQDIDLMMFPCGGASSLLSFFQDVITPILKTGQLCISLFDDDESGRRSNLAVQEYIDNNNLLNIKTLTYPKTQDAINKHYTNFILEDYFPAIAYKNVMNNYLQNAGTFTQLKAIKDPKKIIEDEYVNFVDEHYHDFEVLFDTLLNIINQWKANN